MQGKVVDAESESDTYCYYGPGKVMIKGKQVVWEMFRYTWPTMHAAA